MFDFLVNKFLFNPNEPTGGAAAANAPAAASSPTPPAQTPASQPSAASVPSTTPAAPSGSAITSTPATPVASTGSAPATTPTPAAPSWLDNFRKEGFTTTETDETKIVQQLLQSHRDAERLRPLSPSLSAYQQHQAQFHDWLNGQRTQQPAPQQDWTAQLGFNPPAGDFDQLRRQVTTDASGNITAVAGAPPDAVARFQAHQSFRQEQAEKFLANPYKFVEPAIRHIASQIAAQQAQQNVGQYRETQEAQTFIQKNGDWLFDKGADGGVKTQAVINPQTGRYESKQVLSQWGKTFVNSLREAADAGVPVHLQNDYAFRTTQNAYLSSQDYAKYAATQFAPPAPAAPVGGVTQPGATQTALQAANQAALDRANPASRPSPGSGGNSRPTTPAVTRENLQQVMLQRLQNG